MLHSALNIRLSNIKNRTKICHETLFYQSLQLKNCELINVKKFIWYRYCAPDSFQWKAEWARKWKRFRLSLKTCCMTKFLQTVAATSILLNAGKSSRRESKAKVCWREFLKRSIKIMKFFVWLFDVLIHDSYISNRLSWHSNFALSLKWRSRISISILTSQKYCANSLNQLKSINV